MKKRMILWLAALILLVGAASAEPSIADYNGKRIGVQTGPLMEDAAAEYFPDGETLIFNSSRTV